MKIKTTLKAVALGMSLYLPYAHAGFPVSVIMDIPGQIAQYANMAQMLKDYATAVDQLDKMKQQLQQMEREYNSVTGTRGLGNILNNPDFSKNLPDNWQRILSNIRDNGYDGLSGKAQACETPARSLMPVNTSKTALSVETALRLRLSLRKIKPLRAKPIKRPTLEPLKLTR